MTDRISIAAKMAGDWWADKLKPEYADKREAFAASVALRVEQSLRGEFEWGWWGEKTVGKGVAVPAVSTECDYEAKGLLVESLVESVEPDERRATSPVYSPLPRKHELLVTPDELHPKEGYGNYRPVIQVKEGE